MSAIPFDYAVSLAGCKATLLGFMQYVAIRRDPQECMLFLLIQGVGTPNALWRPISGWHDKPDKCLYKWIRICDEDLQFKTGVVYDFAKGAQWYARSLEYAVEPHPSFAYMLEIPKKRKCVCERCGVTYDLLELLKQSYGAYQCIACGANLLLKKGFPRFFLAKI